jgi:hypothetical protein
VFGEKRPWRTLVFIRSCFARLDNATCNPINAIVKEVLQRVIDTFKTGERHADGWSVVVEKSALMARRTVTVR